MTYWAKIFTIIILLALLLGTGSALAFLLPLPVAHGLSVLAAKN
jgi:hypothetical protein